MEHLSLKQKFFRLAPLTLAAALLPALAVLFILWPTVSWAATVSVSTAATSPAAADTFLARVNLNTDGADLNAVEGEIEISASGAAVKVQEISLGGSVLELWPDSPSITVTGKKVLISFAGGAPAGFNKADALLFTLALTAAEPEDVVIYPRQLTAYVNDGKGSPVAVGSSSLNLSITKSGAAPKNEWQNFVAADKLPPEPFTITFGQDPYVAGGQKFLTFNAIDSDSGLDYYEISEGNRPAVRSGDIYILADQTNLAAVKVSAYDKAGNSREEDWQPPRAPQSTAAVLIIMAVKIIIPILILLVLLTVLIIRLFKWQKSKQ